MTLDSWLSPFAADRVRVLDDPDSAHQALKSLGPVDILLDLIPGTAADYNARWHDLFLHLRPSGCYVIGRTERGDFDRAVRLWVARVLAGAKAEAPVDRAAADAIRVDPEFAASTSNVIVTAKVVVIGKRHRHLLKLRDAETNSLLPQRDPKIRLTELDVLPAGSFESRATVVHHPADIEIEWPPSEIAYPAAHLRHYEGRIAFATHTLFHTDRSILPESFRWHLYDDPSNPVTTNSSKSFARVREGMTPKRTLHGDFYQLDPQHPGYGHVMTEVVSRLWGWDQAKKEFPELKAIFALKHPTVARSTPKFRILRAYGIAEEEIVWTKNPVYLDSVVSATAMWHNNVPYYVRPELADVWQRLGENLMDPAAETHEKIFVSRSDRYARRACRNTKQVEEFFARRGFTIYYPENFDMAEQAAVFAAAKVIAGFGGSGLFNILFARNVETTIILNQDSYYHRNEHLFTSVLGGDVHYYWSPAADVTPDMTKERASLSEWEFDFGRHSHDLDELLASL